MAIVRETYEEVPIYSFRPFAPLTVYKEWGGKGGVIGNTQSYKYLEKHNHIGMKITQQVGGWMYASEHNGWINLNDLEPEQYVLSDPIPHYIDFYKDGRKIYEEKKQDELRLAEVYLELEKYKGDWESLLAKGRINGLHIQGPTDVVPLSLTFSEGEDYGWDHSTYTNRTAAFPVDNDEPEYINHSSGMLFSEDYDYSKLPTGQPLMDTLEDLFFKVTVDNTQWGLPSSPINSKEYADPFPPTDNMMGYSLGGVIMLPKHTVPDYNLNTKPLAGTQRGPTKPIDSSNFNTKSLAGSQTKSGGSGVLSNNLNKLPIAMHRRNNQSLGVNNLYFDYRYGSSQFIENRNTKPLSSVDDYAMFGQSIQTIKNNLNIFDENAYRQVNTRFNRYRLPLPDQHLPRTVPYIFFTRPNIKFTSRTNELQGQYGVDSMFRAIYDQNVEIFNNMELQSHTQHQFNTILGSMARSFEVSDEVIKTIDTGETYTGWKMTYGRNSNESNTASQIGIQYIDDKDLRVYYMHKIWVEYINKVYRGDFQPAREMIINKTLDYATAIYYIVCAADGESILYWAKYYGVFPINTPASVFSWTHGSPQTAPEFTINYAYSMKVEMQPSILAEFNMHSPLPFKYRPIYDKRILTNTPTFVGPPFVERLALKNKKFEYKLRFRN